MFRLSKAIIKPTFSSRIAIPTCSKVERFHSGFTPRKEETSEVASEKKILMTPGYLIDKLGLDDWKRALPIGLIIAVPAITQKWIIFDAETHILACFMLFTGTVYHKFGDSIGAMLDAQSDAILAARNKDEDISIASVQEEIDQHKIRLQIEDITRNIIELQKETMDKNAKLQNLMYPHINKEITLSMLEMEVARQATELNKEQERLIEDSVATVTNQVTSDKNLKKTALDEALATLSNAKSSQKKDAISGLFANYFRNAGDKAKKESEMEKTVTEAERNMLIERIDAKAQRFSHIEGIVEQAEAAKKLIPDKYKGSLAKAFLLAQEKANA